MKRMLLLLTTTALLLVGCGGDYDGDIDKINDRLDAIEGQKLPSVAQQIASIQQSIPALQASSTELREYLTTLQTKANQFEQAISETQQQLSSLKQEVEQGISSAEATKLMADMENLQRQVTEQLAAISNTIQSLKEKDVELEQRITTLQNHIDTELKATKDWAKATFATLEQYNALTNEIATVKQSIETMNQTLTDMESRINAKINNEIAAAKQSLQSEMQQKIDALTAAYTSAIKQAKEEITVAYTTAIQKAISDLESSMMNWVDERLTGYYTIAQMDAKLSALQNTISSSNASLLDLINNIRNELDLPTVDLGNTYEQAIKDAITANNGVIDSKIAAEINKVNARIDSEVATLNQKVAAIEQRMNNLEAQITDLMGRIQSVSYIPSHNDGKASMVNVTLIDQKFADFDFQISPKSAVAELKQVWSTAVTMRAVYTQSRSVEFIEMPILSFEADEEQGIISVRASGEKLNNAVFTGSMHSAAALFISDGNNQLTTDYIEMVGMESYTPTNEIWYQTSDKQIIPINNVASIVSNTYTDDWARLVCKNDVVRLESWFNGNTELTRIAIPSTVKEIRPSALANCSALTAIDYTENNVTLIGESAFSGCSSLVRLTLPNQLTVINNFLFQNCSSLRTISIPNNVTSIGMQAFDGCSSLTSIHIGEAVETIGVGAFSNCNNLTSFSGKFASSDHRCLVINGVLTAFLPKGLTSYTLTDDVKIIGEKAFFNCTELSSVTISNTVTEIGAQAFDGCTAMQSISIPEGVKKIGLNAFANCTALERFEGSAASSDGRCLVIDGALYAFISGSLTEYTIPENVKKITDVAFRGNTQIESITIPATVETIGTYAFANCSALHTINFKNGLTTIEPYAFNSCTALTAIRLPDSTTTLEDYLFASCTELKSIYLGRSITTIPACAFYECTKLEEVTTHAETVINTVGRRAFYKCAALTSLPCEQTIKVYEQGAFQQCNGLTKITLSAAETIGRDAFNNCRSLEQISFGASITKIEANAVDNCSKLKAIYCPATTVPSGQNNMFPRNSDMQIFVPENMVEAYKSDTRWSRYADYIVGYRF